jgi:hypothetical protein
MAGHIRALSFPLLCILYEGLTETLLDLFPFFAAILSSRRLQILFSQLSRNSVSLKPELCCRIL